MGGGAPPPGLLISGIRAGLPGDATSHIIVRFRHLALIMLTLGLGLLLYEAANSASWLTGGADGLQGGRIPPPLEMFRFDPFGRAPGPGAVVRLFPWLPRFPKSLLFRVR